VLDPQRFGRYLLLKRISVGGMAEVYLARATGVAGLQQVVALKRLMPWASQDTEFTTMFLDEARISSRLGHANIARVIEFGDVNGQYFLAMEYIAGKDLRAIHTRLRKTGRGIPVPMALHLGARLCQALGYAHQQRAEDGSSMEIIHRDVSPPNVLVSYDGVVKLIDFGIAKAAARATRTRAGHLKGKIAYMSPEQVQGARLDQRSDLFSLGILLHESLTGRVLFQGDSQIATMHQVRRAEVPPPSATAPEVPPDVDRIVLKALARDRNERYGTAAEMREDIQRHLVRTRTVFGTNHLSDWIQAEFEQDLARERELRKQIRSLRPQDVPAMGEPPPPAPASPAPAPPAGPFEAAAGGTGVRPTAIVPDITPLDVRAPDFSPQDRIPVEATPTDEQRAVGPWEDPHETREELPDQTPVEGTPGPAAGLAELEDEASDPSIPTLERPPPAAAAPARPPEYIGDGLDPPDEPLDGGGLVDDTDPEVRDTLEDGPTERVVAPGDHRERAEAGGSLDTSVPVSPQGPPRDPSQVSVADVDDTLQTGYFQRAAAAGRRPQAGDHGSDGPDTTTRLAQPAARRRLSSTHIIIVAACLTLVVAGLVVLLFVGKQQGKLARKAARQRGGVLISTTPPAACSVALDTSIKRLLSPGESLSLSGVSIGEHQVSVSCVGYQPFKIAIQVNPSQVTQVEARLRKE
jgi:serine/threonine protein kinase